MSVKDEKEKIIKSFEEYNAIKGDVSKARAWVDRYYAPDSITHAPASGDMNFEQIKQYHASQTSTLFPIYKLKNVIVEGDLACVQFTLNLNHQGTFMGIPPTGKKFQSEGVMILKRSGTKMAEIWFYMDMLNFMRQLGAIPAPAVQ
jgi:predicted ester cyclase